MTYQEGDTREPPSYRHHLQLFFKLALGPDASDRCLITNQVDGRRGTLLLAIAGLYVLGGHFFWYIRKGSNKNQISSTRNVVIKRS